MSSTLNHLAPKLESTVGADWVSRESSASNGPNAALVCAPASAEQVATILRICAEAKAAVSAIGGGTGLNVGNAPRQACVAIDLRRLNRVIDHDPANLTVTAESGITLAALRENLSAYRQFLPFDAPYPTRATLGGTIALNLNGPRRGFYGGVRDLAIGMKVALITGEQIKAGGKVVKNVAGYDMCKLFTGSLGTLGVITEATVRVAPLPETEVTILASGTFEKIMAFVDRLSKSQLLPAAIDLMNTQEPDAWQVAVWCEGLAEHVRRHLCDSEVMAQQLGLVTEALRDGAHRELWGGLCNFPLQLERCVYRVTLPRAAIRSFLEALRAASAPRPQLLSDVLIGTLWLSWPGENEFVKIFPQLISVAAEHRGHAVLFAAPSQLKEGIDVWGPPPATYSLMRKIKQQFDPDSLLNAGRFAAGI